MKKEIQTQGIIVKIYALGENSQKITLLSEEGLLTFNSYGTQNSLKRIQLYPLLCACFHLQAQKKTWRLLDLHSIHNYTNLSKDLRKFYSVSVLQEISLHSYANQELFSLFKESCHTLNKADPQLCQYVLIQFWWRWLALNGQQASLNECSWCNNNLHQSFFYAHIQENFLCASCSKSFENSQLFALDQGIKNYLISTQKLSLEQAIRRKLNSSSLIKLSNYLYQKVENILKWKVKSWEEAKYILSLNFPF